METYLDKKTRICLKWHYPASGYVLALQRKKLYRWKTVSWIYPSIVKDWPYQYIREWLEWKENYKKVKKETDKDIGRRIMTKHYAEQK